MSVLTILSKITRFKKILFQGYKFMLYLSEVLMQNPQVDSFEQLVNLIKEVSSSEMFFRIDVKPQFADTPENWEDRLEAAFT